MPSSPKNAVPNMLRMYAPYDPAMLAASCFCVSVSLIFVFFSFSRTSAYISRKLSSRSLLFSITALASFAASLRVVSLGPFFPISSSSAIMFSRMSFLS